MLRISDFPNVNKFVDKENKLLNKKYAVSN